MRLLVITQKIDKKDINLGFFHHWLEAMAKKFDFLEVIGLGAGEYNLPKNVKVYSLGKEKNISRIGKIWNFYKLIFKLRKKYDAVFVHMNPEYVVLGGLLWKLLKKPVYLWYVHKSVPWQLRFAQMFAKKIFTANNASCRLRKRDKIKIVGHGIDTELFKPENIKKDDKFTVLSVGRMSRIKKYDLTISALKKLHKIKYLLIAGIIDSSGRKYKDYLVDLAGEDFDFELIQGVLFEELPSYYNKSDIFVHTSETGSVDKVVLEAMACGLPVLTSGEAFSFLPDKYKFEKGNIKELAKKILEFKNEGRRKHLNLREIVLNDFGLNNLMNTISVQIKNSLRVQKNKICGRI